jgi:hypothetical protein
MIADTDWLAHVAAGDTDIGLALIIAPFTPSEALTLGDLTFTDPAAILPARVILAQTETQVAVVNANGRPGIRITEPLGGFTWQVDDITTGPWEVYGVALVVAGGDIPTKLMASATFPAPIPLTMAGQTIQVSSLLGFFEGTIFEFQTDVISP